MRTVLLLAALALVSQGQAPRDLRIEQGDRPNPLRDKGTRWAVVVGISSYLYLPPAAQLRYAHRDAEDFAAFLRTVPGGAIPGNHIRVLTNEQATLAQIRAAVDTWLTASAGPEDVVYFYFAGHGVLDDRDEGYFVAHDSDPQNLHATALAFQDVDRTLSTRLRSSLVVMIADACHTGRLGWSTYAANQPTRAGEYMAKIGQGDRSFLKILASRPSERSFEDEQDGGHGIFTHALLQGLNGEADRDGDRVVRASEAIDYVSRRVPELTNARQHPQIAGTFDARVALAASLPAPPAAPSRVTLDVAGPARSAVYVDNVFRGAIRPSGGLRVEELAPGPHAFSADFPGGGVLEGSVTLGTAPARVTIAAPAATPLAQLRAHIAAGRVLEPGGAWDFYRSQSFPAADRPAAATLISAGLEELGQACVNDYVQSMASGLKRAMLQRAVDAYERLQTLRPGDAALEARKLFCRGRVQIAEGRFNEAIATIQESLKREPKFACSYNALGVALSRVNRTQEARTAFETAAKLTPEWALPPFQIATQLIAAGDLAKAVPYLEKAVSFNPKSSGTRWSLARTERLLGHAAQAEKRALELIQLDPNYAPVYLELGQTYEMQGNSAKAADAYDTYAQLAPNFADTNQVRGRAEQLRNQSKRPPPTLRK